MLNDSLNNEPCTVSVAFLVAFKREEKTKKTKNKDGAKLINTEILQKYFLMNGCEKEIKPTSLEQAVSSKTYYLLSWNKIKSSKT